MKKNVTKQFKGYVVIVNTNQDDYLNDSTMLDFEVDDSEELSNIILESGKYSFTSRIHMLVYTDTISGRKTTLLSSDRILREYNKTLQTKIVKEAK